ncbi:MAG: PAS domain S-box protein [Verrucomicrobiaceae bacterium]|nr:PAS domain S-box protein [Verrucomicrobiaceae bacterium]
MRKTAQSRKPQKKKARRAAAEDGKSPAPVSVEEMREMEGHAARLERLSQLLLNTAQQAFYVYDHQRRKFLLGHEQISGLYGYKAGEIEGQKDGWFGIVHPDDRELVRESSRQMLADRSNDVRELRMRIRRKQGGYEWIQVHQRVFERDEAGTAVLEVGMVRVITPMVETEAAAKDSRAVWRGLFENNTCGVVVFDCSMRVTDANPMLCRLLKYDRKTLLRLDILDLVATGSRAEVEKLLRCMGGGQQVPASFETRLETRNGTQIDVLAGATCRRDDAGVCRECMMIFTDVSARKAAEAVLKRELEMNRVLIENTPIAIGLLDSEGHIQRLNRAAEDLLGIKSSDAQGMLVWELPMMPAEEVPVSRKRFEGLVRGEETPGRLLTLYAKGGQVRHVIAEASVVRTNHQIEHIVVTGIDVTERKRLESEVIRVAEQEHVRIGADLHDGVGQTLAGVASLTEALVQTLHGEARKDTERILELLKTAQEEVRRLSHGLAPSAVKNRDLAGGLRLIAETVRLNFRRECECLLDDSIQISDKEAETHLFRIAQEAVNNALRHGGARKIRLGLRRHDKNTCLLEIVDDGSGFSTRKADVESLSSGIGLRVMEYRANLLGGQLKIHAQPGRGVRVTCYFPAALLKEGGLTIS